MLSCSQCDLGMYNVSRQAACSCMWCPQAAACSPPRAGHVPTLLNIEHNFGAASLYALTC